MERIDFFNEDSIEKINRATLLYKKLKSYLLKAEELDKNKKTRPQILLEFRNALDHFMRIFLSKNGYNSDIDPENRDEFLNYTNSQIDKFYGHLYRAGYDILDWLSIDLHDKIEEKLQDFSNEAINTIIPDYYPEILPKIDQISLEIAEIREKKDIDRKNNSYDPEDLSENALNNFNDYCTKIDEMIQIHENITKKLKALIEYKKKRHKEKRRLYINEFLIALITGLICVFIGMGIN